MSDHASTAAATAGRGSGEPGGRHAWAAAGLLVSAAGTMACGGFAAAASLEERPSVGLVAAWGCLFMLVLSGLISGRALSRGRAFPRWALGLVLGASVTAQLPLIVAPPALSDDLWRYLHDGRVLAAGINPYLHPPSSARLDEIAGPERPRVNHPDVPTAYPPLAEAGFAVAVMLGGTPLVLKAGLSACGLLLTLLVAGLLPPEQRWRVVVLAWHPLLVLEVAGSGHLDVAAVLLLVAALWAMRRPASRRGRRLAAALLVAGAWIKLLPAVAAVPLARRLGARLAAPTLVLGLAAALPPLLSPVTEAPQPGLAAYAEHWEFNGLVYPWLRAGIERVGLMHHLQVVTDRWVPGLSPWAGPQYTTRALLGLAWLGLLALGWRRGLEDEGAPVTPAFFACAGFVLFTPTLHPWYVLWILPFVALRPSVAWLWLSGAVGLSHASAVAAGGGPWVELAWPRALIGLPFALLLAWEIGGRGRRGRRPLRPS